MPLILAAPYFRKAAPGEIFIPSEYDPYFSQVSILLNMESGEGGIPIDLRGNTFTGNARTTLAQKKFGKAALKTDAATGGIAFVNSPALASAYEAAITIEGWFYFTDLTTKQYLFDPRQVNGESNGHGALYIEGGKFKYQVGNTQDVSGGLTSIPADALNGWNHIAIFRPGSGRIYYTINGKPLGSWGTGTMNATTFGNLGIGRNAFNTANPFLGFIDEVRVTKGRSRYPTSAFTPPAAPFDRTGLKVEGWQVAWYAKQDNYGTSSFAYDLSLDEIKTAKRAAIAYFDSTKGGIVTPLNMYSFDIPQSWKTQHPFSFAANDVMVDAKEEATGIITSGMLRHGYNTFNVRMEDSWVNSPYGRIGITKTKAPFLSGFNSGGTDYASLSDEYYSTGVSTPTKRFIILVQ